MNREQATRSIVAYFDSWVSRDLDRFLSALSDDAVIVECDGSAYRGRDRARRWFVDWHAEPASGRVTDWKILWILFDEGNDVATVEWDFRCIYRGEAGSFLGASVVTFDGTKIARIHKYRMEKPTRTSQD